MSRHVEIDRALAASQPDHASLTGQGTALRQKRHKRPKRQHGPRAQHQFLAHLGSVINIGATGRFAKGSDRRLTKYEFHKLNRPG
jgi:hypothetical protein